MILRTFAQRFARLTLTDRPGTDTGGVTVFLTAGRGPHRGNSVHNATVSGRPASYTVVRGQTGQNAVLASEPAPGVYLEIELPVERLDRLPKAERGTSGAAGSPVQRLVRRFFTGSDCMSQRVLSGALAQ